MAAKVLKTIKTQHVKVVQVQDEEGLRLKAIWTIAPPHVTRSASVDRVVMSGNVLFNGMISQQFQARNSRFIMATEYIFYNPVELYLIENTPEDSPAEIVLADNVAKAVMVTIGKSDVVEAVQTERQKVV